MRGRVPVDPETTVSEERFAVIYAPKRNRTRFPAACTEVMENEETAMSRADPSANRFAARVIGPSRSAGGQYIFYLVEWLGNIGV